MIGVRDHSSVEMRIVCAVINKNVKSIQQAVDVHQKLQEEETKAWSKTLILHE